MQEFSNKKELNGMRLLRESETKEKKYFMSSISFLDAEVEIPSELAYENVMIKGGKGTGKTSKVLIPLYEEWKYGKLYIAISNNYADRITGEGVQAIDMRDASVEISPDALVSSLIKGEAVYLNLDTINNVEPSKKILNGIFQNLLSRKHELTAPILVCCDDIAYMMRIDNLLDYLKSSDEGRKANLFENFYFAVTLCYTRQLTYRYSEETVEEIKKYVTMVDVEKQPEVDK